MESIVKQVESKIISRKRGYLYFQQILRLLVHQNQLQKAFSA